MEPIAIIGIGCRFPRAKNPESFWHLLQNGLHGITEVPANRWNKDALYDPTPATPGKMNTCWGAFLEDIDLFDAEFFRISPREAVSVDPQHRLILEVTWEALENASIVPENLDNSQTGVFLGVVGSDYGRLVFSHPHAIDAYGGTGVTPSIAANRLSYLFNLHGPSLVIDTACSSSLVALHLACQSLHSGESDLCLVGGVNLTLSPEYTLAFSQARMMASDGLCKTFDAAANGYVRGEGCGMIVIKRLSDAIKNQDNILALIRGSAVNHDGLSNGITAPNGCSQQAVITQALKNAGIAPAQISYIEAHGTGTSLGDPIEVESIQTVLGKGRTPDQHCWIGSVKPNIGHLEAAAGIAGLIKVVLSLHHQQIPPHLHLKQLNPLIKLAGTPFSISTQCQSWSVSTGSRIAGVSSFSFGGTNCHVILEEAPQPQTQPKETERPLHLLTLSAQTQNALLELVSRYQSYLDRHPSLAISSVCFSANTGRSHFQHRLAIITSNKEALAAQLTKISAGEQTNHVVSGKVSSHRKSPKIAFLFTGQGSQFVNMGRQLYKTQPLFRRTLEQCDQILQSYFKKSILDILYPQDSQPFKNSLIDQTVYTQATLFSLEYALAQLWLSWGIKPSAVMGHSVGEYVAATLAGVFSLEEGLKLIAHRGRLMQQLNQNGQMLAVLASEETIRSLIASETKVVIAAFNSPQNLVISGQAEAIKTLKIRLESRGIHTKQLQVSHAFHSPLMEPIVAEFAAVAHQITYNNPQLPVISNVTGSRADDMIATASYWVNHIRQPVKFAQSINTLHQEGYKIFLEIGAKPILIGMGKQCLPEAEKVWLPSLYPGQEDWQQMLQSLGKMYVKGVKVNWSGFDQDYASSPVRLPTYPFQRQRYWIETPNTLSQAKPTIQPLSDQTPAKNPQEFIKDWFYEVKWRKKSFGSQEILENYLQTSSDEIDLKLRPQVTHLLAKPDFKQYREFLAQCETLSIQYVLKTFQELGCNFQVGDCFSRSLMVQKLGIVQPHQNLWGRLLEMLCEVGIVQPIDQDQWKVIQVPSIENPEILWKSLLCQYPSASTELTLLSRCASQLTSVLRGETDPVSLVFPEGDLNDVTQLYQNSPESQVMNTLVQQAVLSALEKLPQSRPVRILEIGAGTGGTTTTILPHLNPNQTEYIFTDIGSWFITKAQDKFQDYPMVRYCYLDIEKDPSTQGFQLHQCDLIIAANVLHATQDLQQTLQHIRKLLAPQGLLILLETTSRQRSLDLIFGLLEGWWRFRDFDLRPDYPLLSTQKWQQLLQNSGFQQTVSIPEIQNNNVALSRQAVILAQVADTQRSNPQSEFIGHWLIFADAVVGEQLAQHFQQQGGEYSLVYRGDRYQQLNKNSYQLNPSNSQEFEELIQSIQKNSHFPLKKVIHLWSLDTIVPQDLTITTLKSVQRSGCGAALHLVKALIKTQPLPKLWLVTRGSQSIGSKTEPVCVAASPLWGMGRVIALEHPQIWGGLVDLDPQSTASETEMLFKLLVHPHQLEDHLALRGEEVYVPRLVQQSVNPTQPLSLKPNASYLITGGWGALGLQTAKWMIENNARHLVLIGRSQPSPQQREAIHHLEQQGAKVTVAQADVSDCEELSKIFEQIDTHLPPLKGIIHAAGIGAFQPIEQMTLTQLEAVMAAKVIGGWRLHQLTQHRALDFFVSFSSMTAVWGAIGQAHYAASNCFLEGLTDYRQAQGLPSFTIHWGPWLGGGMAGEQALREARNIGVEPLSPQQGIAALDQFWRSGHIKTTVANVNWDSFKSLYQIGRQRLLLEEIQVKPLTKPPETSVQQKAEILQQLKSSPPTQREDLLIAYLQDEIYQVLRKTSSQVDVQQPLNTMGIDSLMALELRNRLKTTLSVDVPIVKFIENNSIIDLVAKGLLAELNKQLSKKTLVQKLESENTAQNLLINTEDNDWIEGEL
ncbi:MAG: type I polyketide synthase [Limnoraphis sp.]